MTSTVESTYTLSEGVEEEKKISLVDVPGHPSLRPLLQSLTSRAKGIVLVVDSSTPSLTETAELCVDLFSRLPYYIARSSIVSDDQNKDEDEDEPYVLPILVACTKSDLITSKTTSRIQSSLQTEMYVFFFLFFSHFFIFSFFFSCLDELIVLDLKRND